MPRNLRDWSEFGKEPHARDFLKSGDLQAALNGFALERLLQLRFRGRSSDGPEIGFGTTLWLLGDVFGAGMVWSKVCDEAIRGRYQYSNYGTFQGGLLLWFAAVLLKDEDWHSEAEALLDKLLRKRSPMGGSFQKQLAQLLRREIDITQVESGYGENPLYRERQQTQAFFYAGVRAIEEGNVAEAERLWNQVKSPENSLVELEHYLLVHERGRLNPRG